METPINKRVHTLRRYSNRPIVHTRPSNDDITQLSHFGGTPQSLGASPGITPQVSTGQYQQQAEPRSMTARFPEKNMKRIVGGCVWSFAGGFSDAAPGALLPTIEAHYHISYSVVSLIWMANAAGFILVAVFSHKIQPWFGKAKSIPLGCLSSVLMYAMVASGGPFPLIVVGFFFGGVGLAIVLAQVNVFLSKLDKSSKYLSFFHGCYGLGATVSPFVATTMIEHGIRWNYVYIVNLALMVFNLGFLYYAFAGADADLSPWDHVEEGERPLGSEPASQTPSGVPSFSAHTPVEEQIIGLDNLASQNTISQNFTSQNTISQNITSQNITSQNTQAADLGAQVTQAFAKAEPESASQPRQSDMRSALSNKITWMISLFVLCYEGTEVSLGGWIVSYLVDYRHTSASYGYVSSGFWGGLTLGRIALTRPLHKHLGAKRSVILVVYLTLFFMVMTWVVPNDIVSGVMVSLAGLSIGPVYPMLITTSSAMLPRKIQVVSLTIMTAFGSSGGAIVPFVVGLISQSAGTYVVLPVCIATYTVVLLSWYCLHMTALRGQPLPKRILAALW